MDKKEFVSIFFLIALVFVLSVFFVLSLSIVNAEPYSFWGYSGEVYTIRHFIEDSTLRTCRSYHYDEIYQIFEDLKLNNALIETIINNDYAFGCGIPTRMSGSYGCPCSLDGTCDFCVYYERYGLGEDYPFYDFSNNSKGHYNFGVKLKSNGSSSANISAWRTQSYAECYRGNRSFSLDPNCRGIIFETIRCNSNQLCNGISFNDGTCAGNCVQKTCSQAGGYICGNNEVCLSGEIGGSLDSRCCSSPCLSEDELSLSYCSSCGDGFFNLCGRDECVAKDGRDGNGCVFSSNILGGVCSDSSINYLSECSYLDNPGVYTLVNDIYMDSSWIESGETFCFYLLGRNGKITLDLNGHSIYGDKIRISDDLVDWRDALSQIFSDDSYLTQDYTPLGGIYSSGNVAIKNGNSTASSKISGFSNSVDLYLESYLESEYFDSNTKLSSVRFEDFISGNDYFPYFSGDVFIKDSSFADSGGIYLFGGSYSNLFLDNVYFEQSQNRIYNFSSFNMLDNCDGLCSKSDYFGANIYIADSNLKLASSFVGKSNSALFSGVSLNLGNSTSGQRRSILNSFSIHSPDSSLVDGGLNGFEFYLNTSLFPELNLGPVKIRSDLINFSSNQRMHYFNRTIENAFNINKTYDGSFGIIYSPYFEINLPYFDYLVDEEKHNVLGYCFTDAQCERIEDGSLCLNFKCTKL